MELSERQFVELVVAAGESVRLRVGGEMEERDASVQQRCSPFLSRPFWAGESCKREWYVPEENSKIDLSK